MAIKRTFFNMRVAARLHLLSKGVIVEGRWLGLWDRLGIFLAGEISVRVLGG